MIPAPQCQQPACRNRTNDASGLCHLHRHLTSATSTVTQPLALIPPVRPAVDDRLPANVTLPNGVTLNWSWSDAPVDGCKPGDSIYTETDDQWYIIGAKMDTSSGDKCLLIVGSQDNDELMGAQHWSMPDATTAANIIRHHAVLSSRDRGRPNSVAFAMAASTPQVKPKSRYDRGEAVELQDSTWAFFDKKVGYPVPRTIESSQFLDYVNRGVNPQASGTLVDNPDVSLALMRHFDDNAPLGDVIAYMNNQADTRARLASREY